MMISRPMPGPTPRAPRGHSSAPMQPLNYLNVGAHSGYPAPITRTSPFVFRPRVLPPVNILRGSPRPNG